MWGDAAAGRKRQQNREHSDLANALLLVLGAALEWTHKGAVLVEVILPMAKLSSAAQAGEASPFLERPLPHLAVPNTTFQARFGDDHTKAEQLGPQIQSHGSTLATKHSAVPSDSTMPSTQSPGESTQTAPRAMATGCSTWDRRVEQWG